MAQTVKERLKIKPRMIVQRKVKNQLRLMSLIRKISRVKARAKREKIAGRQRMRQWLKIVKKEAVKIIKKNRVKTREKLLIKIKLRLNPNRQNPIRNYSDKPKCDSLRRGLRKRTWLSKNDIGLEIQTAHTLRWIRFNHDSIVRRINVHVIELVIYRKLYLCVGHVSRRRNIDVTVSSPIS